MNSGRERLGRVHRIRQLEEDQSRLALQSTVAALRQAEARIERALLEEAAARDRRNAALLENGGKSEEWKSSESEAQIHRVLAVRDARALPSLVEEVGLHRELYFDRRRERQKLEGLVKRAAEEQKLETEQKDRKEIDDLHQARRRYDLPRS
jgi:flagellar biosynthesis chaperone FliJ